MTDSDRTDADEAVPADSEEAGNFVEPVDHGDSRGEELGTDPETDKGDFTTSTDRGTGERVEPNVDRPDGDYTTSQSHIDDATDDGEYTDRENRNR